MAVFFLAVHLPEPILARQIDERERPVELATPALRAMRVPMQ